MTLIARSKMANLCVCQYIHWNGLLARWRARRTGGPQGSALRSLRGGDTGGDDGVRGGVASLST